MNRKLCLLTALILGVLVLLTGCMEEPAEPTLHTFGDSGISVYSDWSWGRDVNYSIGYESDYITVSGTLINGGLYNYNYLELWAEFLDSSGYVIKKEYINFVDFNVGEKRTFEVSGYLPRADVSNVRIYVKY